MSVFIDEGNFDFVGKNIPANIAALIMVRAGFGVCTGECVPCTTTVTEDIMTSTLDPDNDNAGEETPPVAPGHDIESLGPGDSSDSGSDTLGAKRHEFDRDTELDNHALELGADEERSDTDRSGTGERASADGDETLRPDDDVLPDRIEGPEDI
ncbi:hypothetical protein [Paraburkholderia tropica]|nr:hypothetical protein [Paraburkholderia tropica]